jgi:hypothetical protein
MIMVRCASKSGGCPAGGRVIFWRAVREMRFCDSPEPPFGGWLQAALRCVAEPYEKAGSNESP